MLVVAYIRENYFGRPGNNDTHGEIHRKIFLVTHLRLHSLKLTCLGYFAYLLQNLEGNDHAGNLITICLKHE